MTIKIRKRVILTILLTLITLFFTKNIWLETKPIVAEFEIENAKDSRVEVLLNKKFDDEFLPCRTRKSKVRIKDNNKHNVVIKVKTEKKAKKVRFIISELEKDRIIELTNLRLHIGKCKLDKLDEFSLKNGELKVENNTLLINPKEDSVELNYNVPINERAPLRFVFETFIIILVLSSLFSYKIMDYVADFSSIKHKSRIDIIFLSIFFIMLFIPISHINQEKTSLKENRNLAVWKPLINKDGALNYNFGKDYEAWFNDRFNLRSFLVKTNSVVYRSINKIYRTEKITFDKKYNLLYSNHDFLGLRLNNITAKEDLQLIYKNLIKFNQYCKDNNIKLYILFVPRWSDFYTYTSIESKLGKVNYLDDLVNLISKDSELRIIYPKEEMIKENKNTPMYFKTDHHWTKKGAFICYKELMKEISKDFNNIYVIQESDLTQFFDKKVQATWDQVFYNGRTFVLSGFPESLANKILDTDYLYYKNPRSKDLINNKKIKYSRTRADIDEEFYYPYGINKKALLISNSFGQQLVEFLPYSFQHTLRLYDNERIMDMQIYDPIIKDYRPDVIILNFQAVYIRNLLNMYKKENQGNK